MQYSHIFGPVRSRRLGRSLGVNLVPGNVCSYDCVYCECGCTTAATLERNEFFPECEVIAELTQYLASSPVLDFVTFSGSGEPTLSRSIGPVIRFLKQAFPEYQVAVLTNGTLLGREDVREALVPADVVIPTLSSAFESTWRRIHRPAPGISFGAITAGFRRFHEEYPGEIWIEVFVVPGLNTSDKELSGLARLLRELQPERVQLNTLDRPGTEESVRPASLGELERIRAILSRCGVRGVEPVGSRPSARVPTNPDWDTMAATISGLIQKEPLSIDDLVNATGMARRDILKVLGDIGSGRPVARERRGERLFYSAR